MEIGLPGGRALLVTQLAVLENARNTDRVRIRRLATEDEVAVEVTRKLRPVRRELLVQVSEVVALTGVQP